MQNKREEWYDKDAGVAVTIVDVKDAAQALARGHLCGPTSAYFLSKALAAAALLGSEMSQDDETLILQMKCKGPLGGFNVECTRDSSRLYREEDTGRVRWNGRARSCESRRRETTASDAVGAW